MSQGNRSTHARESYRSGGVWQSLIITMTLTTELGRDIMKVHPHTKICVHTSNGLAVRALSYTELQTDRHTHTHTGPILLPRPLTREVKRGLHTWPYMACYILQEIPTLCF